MTAQERERLTQAIGLGLTGEQILGIMGMYEEPNVESPLEVAAPTTDNNADYGAMFAQMIKAQADLTAQIAGLQQELKAAAFRQPVNFAQPEKTTSQLAAEEIMAFLNPTTKEVITNGKN